MKTYFGTVIQKLRDKSTNQELLTLIDILEQNHFDEVNEAVAKAYAEKWQLAMAPHKCEITIRENDKTNRIVAGVISDVKTCIDLQGHACSDFVVEAMPIIARKIATGPVDVFVGPTDTEHDAVYLGRVSG